MRIGIFWKQNENTSSGDIGGREGDDRRWPQSFKDCVGGVRSTVGEVELEEKE